jgi:hypothetical protein
VRRRKVSSLILLLVLSSALASCRTAIDQRQAEQSTPPLIVQSTPPFPTKEPDRYRAVRTVTHVSPGGNTTSSQTSLFRDGPLRREEVESGDGSKWVYLEKAGQRFVLLPDKKLYAALEDQNALPNQTDNPSDDSPDRLLHMDPIQAAYQKLPDEVIDGRNVSKYRVVVNASSVESVSKSVSFVWIDEKLGMPIKSDVLAPDGAHTTMLLSAISFDVNKEVFDIPAGYQKLPAPQVIGQIKPTNH